MRDVRQLRARGYSAASQGPHSAAILGAARDPLSRVASYSPSSTRPARTPTQPGCRPVLGEGIVAGMRSTWPPAWRVYSLARRDLGRRPAPPPAEDLALRFACDPAGHS